jgi:SAM-dependent methyltransferase
MGSDPEAVGWFEELYARARDGEAVVPWDRGAPNPLILRWTQERGLDGTGRGALVVGAGLGDDAEHVASLGFATTAFDISPTAVAEARRRHPGSRVEYVVADLLDLPARWRGAFDLVVESITVQSLPIRLHEAAIDAVAGTVAPGGTLLVQSGAREPDEHWDGPPWPLTRSEVERFAGPTGLELVSLEDVPAGDEIRRWRAELRRPA